MIQEVDILIGLPGSGKSYWSLEKVRNNINVASVSRDKIRELLKVDYSLWPFNDTRSSKLWNKLEKEITLSTIERVINFNLNLIIDETHITKKARSSSVHHVRIVNPNLKVNYIWLTETENNLKYRMQSPKNGSENTWKNVIETMKKNFEEPTLQELDELRINKFYKVSREQTIEIR